MSKYEIVVEGHKALADVTPEDLVTSAKAREFCRLATMIAKPHMEKIRKHAEAYFTNNTKADMILVDVYKDPKGRLRFSSRDPYDEPEPDRVVTLRAFPAHYQARTVEARTVVRVMLDYEPDKLRGDPTKLKQLTFKK